MIITHVKQAYNMRRLFFGGRGWIRFDPIARFYLFFELHKKCRDQNPGRENHPPDDFLIRPSNPFHQITKEKPPRRGGFSLVAGMDSNPRFAEK